MTCECRWNIEEQLLAQFKADAPEASKHKSLLTGYVMICDKKGLNEKGCMGIELTALYPLKKGDTKIRKSKQNMIFTYCPFCGKKYDNEQS